MSRGIWRVSARLTDSPGSPEARRWPSNWDVGEDECDQLPSHMGRPKTDACRDTQGPIRTNRPVTEFFPSRIIVTPAQGSLNDVLKGLSHFTRPESYW